MMCFCFQNSTSNLVEEGGKLARKSFCELPDQKWHSFFEFVVDEQKSSYAVIEEVSTITIP